MAIEKAFNSSPSSTTSDDYHFSTLSSIEKQSLLQDDGYSHNQAPSSPETNLPTPRSTKFLDGVRGVAAFLVYLHHFAPNFYFENQHRGFGQTDAVTGETWRHFYSLPYIRIFYTGGDAAVALFFVLSGYVLTISPLRKIINLAREGGSRESWRGVVKSLLSATIRRPIRLYLPALLFALTYAFFRHTSVGPLGTYPDLQPSIPAELMACLREFGKFFNPFQQHGINRAWFPYGVVVWTIPIEFKGSMLVFGLTGLYAFASHSRFYRRLYFFQLIVLAFMLLLLNQWTASLFISGMVLAIADIHGQHLTSLPLLSRISLFRRSGPILNHIILLLGGYLLTEPSHKSSIDYSFRTPGWHYLTTLIPKAYLTPSGEVSWFDPEYFRFWTSIGGVMTLYAILRLTWLQSLFARRIPMYLGHIAFALYLTHVTTIVITGTFFLRLVGQFYGDGEMGSKWYDNKLYLPEWGFTGFNVRYLVSLAMQVPVSLAVAHIVTKAYDLPSLRFAHWVARMLGLTSTGAGSGARSENALASKGMGILPVAKMISPSMKREDEDERFRERRLA